MTKFGYRLSDVEVLKEEHALPTSPFLYLGIDSYLQFEDGMPRLSPQLMSDGEIDYYIKELKTDLDRVGREAKRALERAHLRTHEILRDKLAK